MPRKKRPPEAAPEFTVTSFEDFLQQLQKIEDAGQLGPGIFGQCYTPESLRQIEKLTRAAEHWTRSQTDRYIPLPGLHHDHLTGGFGLYWVLALPQEGPPRLDHLGLVSRRLWEDLHGDPYRLPLEMALDVAESLNESRRRRLLTQESPS